MTDTLHHLEITLKNVKPPVVREVLVASDLRMDRLHAVIQVSMGWTDSHMHEFIVGTLRGGERFGTAAADAAFGPPRHVETRFTLEQIAPAKSGRFLYVYDFGDDWHHEIGVKAVVAATPDQPVPACIKAARACPPEDCGGPPGYANLLEALADPAHEEHADVRDWFGDDFDPGHVDLDAINDALNQLTRRWSRAPRKGKVASCRGPVTRRRGVSR